MNNPTHFPTWLLGKDLEQIVFEIHQDSKAPIPSIVSGLLTVLSLVCQGRITIRKRPGLISPVSLWFIVVLGSGERKSSVLEKFLEAIEQFTLERDAAYKDKLGQYETAMSAWKNENKGILAAITKSAKDGDAAEREKQRLVDHATQKPIKPKAFKLIMENSTPEAIKATFHDCLPTTGLISDEASAIFAGRALSDLGFCNKIFDGGSVAVDRITKPSFVIRDATLTTSFYVQQEVLDAYLSGKGDLARSVGFLARFFYVCPPPSAGSRFLAYSRPADQAVLDRFNDRVSDILEKHVMEDGQSLPGKTELSFSTQAQARWEQEHDRVEGMMALGGYLYSVRDFGSKLPDKMARLAAIFHHFGGNEGPIQLETLEAAIGICCWFAEEFVRNFTRPPAPPQEVQDAHMLLLPWVANYIRTHNGVMSIKKTDLRRDVASQLRNKMRLNAALTYLWGINAVVEQKHEKTMWVHFNPQFFTPQQVMWLCSQGAKC